MTFDQNNPWIKRNITYIYGVPYVAFGFWFGNKMLGEREKVYKKLVANIGPPFYLITIDNISDFEFPKHPFNPAVTFTLKNKKGLSGVHLSDYFRTYISYHYGGAYHDIKLRMENQSISTCWEIFEDPNVWVVGMPNRRGGASDPEVIDYIINHETYNPNTTLTEKGKWNYRNLKDDRLIGNGGWIARPKTLLFQKVNDFVEIRLKKLFQMIRSNPVENFKRCCLNGEVFMYPVAWAALQGNIFHPYQVIYFSHINRNMPIFEKAQYRHSSENV